MSETIKTFNELKKGDSFYRLIEDKNGLIVNITKITIEYKPKHTGSTWYNKLELSYKDENKVKQSEYIEYENKSISKTRLSYYIYTTTLEEALKVAEDALSEYLAPTERAKNVINLIKENKAI